MLDELNKIITNCQTKLAKIAVEYPELKTYDLSDPEALKFYYDTIIMHPEEPVCFRKIASKEISLLKFKDHCLVCLLIGEDILHPEVLATFRQTSLSDAGSLFVHTIQHLLNDDETQINVTDLNFEAIKTDK